VKFQTPSVSFKSPLPATSSRALPTTGAVSLPNLAIFSAGWGPFDSSTSNTFILCLFPMTKPIISSIISLNLLGQSRLRSRFRSHIKSRIKSRAKSRARSCV